MIRVTDDRGRVLSFSRPPARIVSLVPSDSYTLLRLGCGERLVGRTEYCVEPAGEVAALPTVGGTKDADVECIADLRPDLVVANQEENRRVDIERLEQLGLPVLLSFPRTVQQGLTHTERLVQLLGEARSEALAALEVGRQQVERLSRTERVPIDTFVPIWMDPLMTANGATFLSDVVELVGGRNVFAARQRRYPLSADLGRRAPLPPEQVSERDTRYPRVTFAEVTERQPALVLLPDEPHEFSDADAEVFRGLAIPAAVRDEAGCDAVSMCDGRDLMWYGLRCLEGLGRIEALVDAARARQAMGKSPQMG
jgi:ABC-type Fe3+-hydroxamate transport system substrate-binding protein